MDKQKQSKLKCKFAKMHRANKTEAIFTKLINNAVKNGHDMSQFSQNSGYSIGKDWTYTYLTHCRKCAFEIEVDHMKTISGEKVYLAPINLNTKCDR